MRGAASAAVRKKERPIERLVSEHIGAVSVLWLEVDDEPGPQSDRVYLERNAIALLSGREGPIDEPGDQWLGNHSTRETIRSSGLWNLNHTDEVCEPDFLDRLALYVGGT